MYELFKTVFILSVLGFVLTALLLILKPVTSKKFPAKWQYYVWIAVMISMVMPVYKLIPKHEAQKIPIIPQSEINFEESSEEYENVEPIEVKEIPIADREVHITQDYNIRLLDLLAYIWFFGICIYLIVACGSYAVYIIRKRKNAVWITENAVLEDVKKELKIKRHIKVRMSSDVRSPMLVGIFYPVIYIPCREIIPEYMRMVFLHELTHYKRRDLLIKWFSLFVNAIHWFNPLAYLICANVSESCEVSCDMEVTKNMSEEEQKTYMKTILDLVE